jgi:hypothetical protein
MLEAHASIPFAPTWNGFVSRPIVTSSAPECSTLRAGPSIPHPHDRQTSHLPPRRQRACQGAKHPPRATTAPRESEWAHISM